MASDPSLWLLVFMGVGLFLFFSGFKAYRKDQLIKDTPRSKVRSIAMGLVELSGEAKMYSGKMFTSPLTRKPCLHYDFKIEEERGSGKNRHWVTVRSDVQSCLFYLKDETGSVLVDPNGAEYDLPKSFSYSSSLFSSRPQAVVDYLSLNPLTGLYGGPLRFTEYLLGVDDAAFIMGTAGLKSGAESASNQNEDSILIQKGSKDAFFLISDKSVKDVEHDLAWTAIGGVLGGSLLFLGGLFFLLLDWHLL